jgi:hypothetical protein
MPLKRYAPRMEDQVKFTVYLPRETQKALRHAAIDEGIAATRLVERLIEEYLKPKRGPRK